MVSRALSAIKILSGWMVRFRCCCCLKWYCVAEKKKGIVSLKLPIASILAAIKGITVLHCLAAAVYWLVQMNGLFISVDTYRKTKRS